MSDESNIPASTTQHPSSMVADNKAPQASADTTTDASPQAVAAAQNPISNPTGKAPEAKKTAEAPKAAPTETKAQEAARKFKLKVDGRDEEYSEADTLRLAQLGRASDKRFQEAAEMRKQSEEFVKLLKTPEGLKQLAKNPNINLDLRKFAEDLLVDEMKKEALTPEQRRIEELQAQLREHETKKQELETQRQQAEQKALEDHYAQDFDQKITKAISTAGLPKTPETVKRMVNYMSNALENGIDVEPENVIELVKQDYSKIMNDVCQQFDGEALIKILGDQITNKIRKFDLAQLRASQQPVTTTAPAVKAEPKQHTTSNVISDQKPMNIHEWRASLNKRNGR